MAKLLACSGSEEQLCQAHTGLPMMCIMCIFCVYSVLMFASWIWLREIKTYLLLELSHSRLLRADLGFKMLFCLHLLLVLQVQEGTPANSKQQSHAILHQRPACLTNAVIKEAVSCICHRCLEAGRYLLHCAAMAVCLASS